MNNIITQEENNRIDAICKRYLIKRYVINSDGTIDVDGDVNLDSEKLLSIPLRFGKVSGSFYCSQNKLTSLDGSPISVGRNFFCQDNYLSSLKYCPIEVGGGHINCRDNRLTSLEHCPKECSGGFLCDNNKLTSLAFCPTEVGDEFCVDDNPLTQGFWQLFNTIWGDPDDNDMAYGDVTDEQLIFLRYQHYYEVWVPEFNQDNMQLLIDDIKDGLR